MRGIQRLNEDESVLTLDKKIYHIDAILTTTYKFTNEFYIHVSDADADHYCVSFDQIQSNSDIGNTINKFCNELIDQQVRYNLAISNKAIKALIIKKAFFPFPEDE